MSRRLRDPFISFKVKKSQKLAVSGIMGNLINKVSAFLFKAINEKNTG
jgi:hypothetical protein